MEIDPHPSPSPATLAADSSLEDLATRLAEAGVVVAEGFLDSEVSRQLRDEAETAWQAEAFQRGGVGKGEGRQVRGELRTDHICWLERGALTEAQAAYWEAMEELRHVLNHSLFLGLFELEAHLARFSAGGYYKPHLDRHRQTQERVLSAVLYLDEDWQLTDGGALRLYPDREQGLEGESRDVFPEPAKLVLFLSAEIWHEVRPSARPRHTVTGWFRSRPMG